MAQIKLHLDPMCLCTADYMKPTKVEDDTTTYTNAQHLTVRISTDEGNTLSVEPDGLYATGDPGTCGLQLISPQIHDGILVGYYSEWNKNTEGHNASRVSCSSIVHKTWTADDIQGTNLRGVNPNDQRRESDLDGDHGTGTKSSNTNTSTSTTQTQTAETNNGVTEVLPRKSDDAPNVIFRVKVKPGSHMYDIDGTTVTERTGEGSTFTTPASTVFRIKEVKKVDSTYYVHQSIDGGWWAIIPLELVPSEYRDPSDPGGSDTPETEEANPYDDMDAILVGDFLRIQVSEGDDPHYDYYIIISLKEDGTIDQVVKILEDVPDSDALHDFDKSDEEEEEGEGGDTPAPDVPTEPGQLIKIQFDERVIKTQAITYNKNDYDASITEDFFVLKLSSKPNNGLKLDENGMLIARAKLSDDPGFATYYPGNGIKNGKDGTYQPMSIIRCNSTVSRIKSGDPLSDNEGVNTNTIVRKILEQYVN